MSYKTTRRSFIRTSAILAAGAAVLPRLSFGADSTASETLTADLGKVSDFDSDPTLVSAELRDSSGKKVDDAKLYVRKTADGWVVLSAICTHLKCKIKYDSKKSNFLCPCHKSEFDLSGHVLKKPAKKDLPDYSGCVSEENGHLIWTKS